MTSLYILNYFFLGWTRNNVICIFENVLRVSNKIMKLVTRATFNIIIKHSRSVSFWPS